jgi:hypothetical protein
VAALEDAYFEAAAPISTGVLVGQGGHVITFESANPLTRELLYFDPWPTDALLPRRQAQPPGARVANQRGRPRRHYRLRDDRGHAAGGALARSSDWPPKFHGAVVLR